MLDPDDRAELADARVVGVAGEDLDDVALVRCVVEGVRLTAASARRVRLTDVVLRDCELSGLDLQEARLRRVRIERCRATGLEGGALHAADVAVVDTKLADAGLRMTEWERVAFVGVEATGVDWTAASLRGASFVGCDLSGAVLSRCRMDEVTFRASGLDDLVGARALAGAVVDGPQLVPVALALFADLGIGLAGGDEDPRPLTPAGLARPRGHRRAGPLAAGPSARRRARRVGASSSCRCRRRGARRPRRR